MHVLDTQQVESLLEAWEERLEESIYCIHKFPAHQCNWEDNLEALEAIHLLWKIKTKYLAGEQAHPHSMGASAMAAEPAHSPHEQHREDASRRRY